MTEHYDSPSSLYAGLHCRCPRCGEGKLFRGFLAIAPSCERCGLDYGFADPADGPAFFVMSGVGLLVTALWAWWAVAFSPPIWAQLSVSLTAMTAGCLGCLRPVKAWLVAEQFVRKAEEGRWQSVGTHGQAPEGYNARGF